MRLLVLLLALTALTACGLTGDLYLPEPKPETAPAADPAPPAEPTRVPVEEKDKDDENPGAPRPD